MGSTAHNAVAFFCTSPKGWEADDFRLLFGLVAALIALHVVSYWIRHRYQRPSVNMVQKIVLGLGTIVIIIGIGLVIWIAPC
ncbi:hypothetical protein BH23PAT1_BH23PAT1_0240 [soil metagenome]